jgi:hypothetical protein
MLEKIIRVILSVLGFFLDRKAANEKPEVVDAETPVGVRQRIRRKLQKQSNES